MLSKVNEQLEIIEAIVSADVDYKSYKKIVDCIKIIREQFSPKIYTRELWEVGGVEVDMTPIKDLLYSIKNSRLGTCGEYKIYTPQIEKNRVDNILKSLEQS